MQSTLLLEALFKAQVRFAHWKGNNHLPQSLEGQTDIELLIDPDYREKFEEVMKSLHFKKAISPKWDRYPKVEDWLGFDPETGKILHLHTHYALVTGIKYVKHLYLPWLSEFFNQLRIDKRSGWPIPKAEMEIIILLIRIWAKLPPNQRLKKRPEIPINRIEELKLLLEEYAPKQIIMTCRMLKLKIPPDFIPGLEKFNKENDPEEIIRLSKYFYQQVKKYYRKSWLKSLVKSYFHKYQLKTISFFFRYLSPVSLKKKLVDGGVIVALIGSDGSGKSTLSRDLVDWLIFKIDTHYFYFGKDPHILSYRKKLFSFSQFLHQDNKFIKRIRRGLGELYHLFLPWKKIKMLKLAHKMRQKGCIIICDRFPQHQINGMHDGPKMQKGTNFFSKKESLLFQQFNRWEPDLVFKLKVKPETASLRKPEHNKGMIEEKCKNFDQIQFHKAKVIEIDANQPYSKVLLTLKSELWKELL